MSTKKVLLPFRFPGGKYYALNRLRQFWEAIEHDEYREPFAGGGSVFFAKQKTKWNWLNDIDEQLMTTYSALADPNMRLELVNLVEKETASRERWSEVRNLKPTDDLGIAFRYYYMNRTSFSGKMSSPGWGYRDKRSLPPERWAERIIPCGKKLEGVELTCKDFNEVIISPSKGSQVLLYVDPPYYAPPKRKHYVSGFDKGDHERLCKLLESTNHKFFLTYDYTKEIEEMYSWANTEEIEFYYRVGNSRTSGNKRSRKRELVITNYQIGRRSKLDDYL
ncbi:MAG: DNA adenine methylase [Thermoplasmata archaeon]|nr:DNA adenine methylase [Thermoplasmata archaeon]